MQNWKRMAGIASTALMGVSGLGFAGSIPVISGIMAMPMAATLLSAGCVMTSWFLYKKEI